MKMAELHYDTEQAKHFLKPLALEDYHREVSEHLQFVEHGASMICRRVNSMTRRPEFFTIAQEQMERAEMVLKHALARVQEARAAYEQKQQERA